jgi:hypothetical protein
VVDAVLDPELASSEVAEDEQDDQNDHDDGHDAIHGMPPFNAALAG